MTTDVEAWLVRRARAEYLEMPGLRLTVWQAARLLGVDADVCEAVLTRLVSIGFLGRNREGAYVLRESR